MNDRCEVEVPVVVAQGEALGQSESEEVSSEEDSEREP